MSKPEPESVSQASTWESVKNNALAAGLCHQCACQLAWHLQERVTATRPPCDDCAPIVASLPVPRGSGWRSVVGSASDSRNWQRWRAGLDLISSAHGEGTPGVPRAAEIQNQAPVTTARELRRPAYVDERLLEREG